MAIPLSCSMTELNEYECGMLDELLEAFGVPDSLTRRQVMALFDQDEATAFAMVQILLREELAAEIGDHGNFDLPEKLILKPKGARLLRNGGFTKLYRQEQPEEVGGALSRFQQQALALENQRLVNEREIAGLKWKLKLVSWLHLLWVLLIALLLWKFLSK